MHCEEARGRLIDRLDGPAIDAAELAAHLESCQECRELENDILAMESQARVWHDINPPRWNPDPGPWQAPPDRIGGWAPHWLRLIRQWFPVLASSAALLLAAGIYLQGDRPGAPQAPTAAAAPQTAAPATEALLATSRRERQQEMEALTALLKAEMDRRSLETEQSLKYIISHQIQSQRELESMRGRLMQTEANAREQL
jgi:hypothetical protein